METAAGQGISEAQALERGAILTFAPCPFRLPDAPELAFLRDQRPAGGVHKDIALDPACGALTGYRARTPAQAEHLALILRRFAGAAGGWLAGRFPGYARRWEPGRVCFRAEEEATRKLRRTARNDLLHFDAFPSRPARGRRILRLFVNVHPTDDRVWATSETFAAVLGRYGRQVGLPGTAPENWVRRLGHGLLNLFQPGASGRTEYDLFMLRLHHFLKTCDPFQERAPRRLWHFRPGSAWLLFTDAISHAELRGQFALEHSFFIAPDALALPDESPLAVLTRACAGPALAQVA